MLRQEAITNDRVFVMEQVLGDRTDREEDLEELGTVVEVTFGEPMIEDDANSYSDSSSSSRWCVCFGGSARACSTEFVQKTRQSLVICPETPLVL